jgi:ATP phosphoribosyltransferase regulatory subunit
MGFLNGVLNEASPDMQLQKAIRRCLEEKNAHELSAVTEGKVSPESAARFTELLKLPEDFGLAVERADALCVNDEMKQAVAELKALYGAMRAGGVAGAARLDFSIGSDEAYYNGLMFRGYVRGVPRAVLSGGRYDPLLSRMGKPQMQAIGFAFISTSWSAF